MYDGGYGDGAYFDQHHHSQQQQQQQQQGHYSQQVQHQYSTHGSYGGFSEQQHAHADHNHGGGQMVGDLGCYGLHANGEFADISSLEPSIYPQQLIAEEQQQFGASHQSGYQSATLPIVSSGQQLYRPVSFNNSPTGSSQASTGSEEGEEFYANWHPYKRSPPNASLMMASAVGGEMLDCKKRGGKATKKRKPKKDPNEPQKPVSAYALFFRDTQAAIKGQNPNASFGEVSKIVASMWDGLDAEAKNNYKQKTEVAKKDYLKQLAAYRANQISRSGGNPCSMMEALGHADYSVANNPGKLFAQATAGSSPDSTTSNGSDSKEAIVAADLGGKTLASMIAEPAPQQVLTATTTLTLRNKSDYDDSSDGPNNYPLCVRTNNSNEQSDARWEHDFRPNEGLVQHCRDVFNIWGPSRPPPSTAAPPGYLPV